MEKPKFVIGEQPEMQPEAGPENRRWELPEGLEQEIIELARNLFNREASVGAHGEGQVGEDAEEADRAFQECIARMREIARVTGTQQ